MMRKVTLEKLLLTTLKGSICRIKTMHNNILKNEKGFVLVASLLILVILVIIGIAATTTTTIELQIAGNEKVHKQTFYSAEAGAVLGAGIIDESLLCPAGFTEVVGETYADLDGQVRAYSLTPYQNTPYDAADMDIEAPDEPTIAADAAFPVANLPNGVVPTNFTEETTYLYLGGATHMLPGGALQMAAGYEGKGKGAAGGGVFKKYDIFSKHSGLNDSDSRVLLGWQVPVDWTGTGHYCN